MDYAKPNEYGSVCSPIKWELTFLLIFAWRRFIQDPKSENYRSLITEMQVEVPSIVNRYK